MKFCIESQSEKKHGQSGAHTFYGKGVFLWMMRKKGQIQMMNLRNILWKPCLRRTGISMENVRLQKLQRIKPRERLNARTRLRKEVRAWET